MIYFFGNCQMDFLQRSFQGFGLDSVLRLQASPLCTLLGKGFVPDELQRFNTHGDLNPYLQGRTLKSQFEMISDGDEQPSLMVFNLYHESAPLFAHARDGYVFHLDPRAWDAVEGLEAWMKRHCRMIDPNPMGYFKRFGEMLAKLRKRFPIAPMVVVSRLGHHPFFGPNPHSYLDCWEKWWRQFPEIFPDMATYVGNCHMLDMDRVMAGIMHEKNGETAIEAHCPFLKITLEREHGVPAAMLVRRDMEHVADMWPVMARKLIEFLEHGRFHYSFEETVPPAWETTPFRPERLDEDRIDQLLGTGGNYQTARAVSAMLWDARTDHTPLLALNARATPVCQHTLSMIRNYARIVRNPSIAYWCRTHAEKAAAYTDNGPSFREQYLDRLAELEAEALGWGEISTNAVGEFGAA